MRSSSTTKNGLTSMTVLGLVLAFGGCAALQPTDANGPRSDVQPYPIGLADPTARLEEASLAWYQLSQQYGIPERTEANLQPYTATIQSLPANLSTSIRLPKVGAETNPGEEETRESLRRFILEWRRLIGAEPDELSLVERTDEPSGVKLARYEQRPFRYPLRGGYGNLIIRFRNDRRLVSLSSNCIPNAERLLGTIGGLAPKITWEEAASHIKSEAIRINDSSGQRQTFSLPAKSTIEAGQLVVYALPSTNQSGLELRLAWEIIISSGPIKTVYLDAISGQVIAGS